MEKEKKPVKQVKEKTPEQRKRMNQATMRWRKKACTAVAIRLNYLTEKGFVGFVEGFPHENYEDFDTHGSFMKQAVREKAINDGILNSDGSIPEDK